MPRMVVLWHEVSDGDKFHRASHYDFMLEADGVLRTWALERWPIESGQSVAATRLTDHRVAYLEYQGPISGNRGTVCRVDQGEYQLLDSATAQVKLHLVSKQCEGCFVIERGYLSKSQALKTGLTDAN